MVSFKRCQNSIGQNSSIMMHFQVFWSCVGIISNKFLWRDQLGAEKFERYDNMRMIEKMKYSRKNAASLKVQLRSFK